MSTFTFEVAFGTAVGKPHLSLALLKIIKNFENESIKPTSINQTSEKIFFKLEIEVENEYSAWSKVREIIERVLDSDFSTLEGIKLLTL